MTFWLLYDHAGPLILLNLLTLAAVLVPVWAITRFAPNPPFLAPATAVLAGSAALAGQAELMAALLAHREFSFRHVARGVVRHGLRVAILAAVYGAGIAAAGFGVWFYSVRIPDSPAVRFLLTGACVSAGLTMLMSGVYLLPALVFQRGSLGRAARTSALLMGGHPLFTIGLLITAAGCAAGLATPPGIVLFSTLPLVALTCSAYELIARQYAVEEQLAGGAPIRPLDADTMLDENELYLNRGFRDFLFPWKI